MTLLNRVREWQAAGVWQRLHETLPARLRGEGKIDFDRVVVDASHVRALHGGKKRGRVPWTGRNAGPNTARLSSPKSTSSSTPAARP